MSSPAAFKPHAKRHAIALALALAVLWGGLLGAVSLPSGLLLVGGTALLAVGARGLRCSTEVALRTRDSAAHTAVLVALMAVGTGLASQTLAVVELVSAVAMSESQSALVVLSTLLPLYALGLLLPLVGAADQSQEV